MRTCLNNVLKKIYFISWAQKLHEPIAIVFELKNAEQYWDKIFLSGQK